MVLRTCEVDATAAFGPHMGQPSSTLSAMSSTVRMDERISIRRDSLAFGGTCNILVSISQSLLVAVKVRTGVARISEGVGVGGGGELPVAAGEG
jgi:tryptophan synthase beta subunit